jgi:metal-sulfur cluster biosynthetic enzyme
MASTFPPNATARRRGGCAMPPIAARAAEARAALAAVTDPELDQSVVELGFIAGLSVAGERVAVAFRLPTFWCSAGFAWIMAEDMRAALMRLPWVGEAEVRLVDHFAAERINAGVTGGEGFRSAFGAEAAGDLAALRETFRRKAFLGRMAALIEALRQQGLSDAAITALTLAGLAACGADRGLVTRYSELRAVYGGPAGEGDAAFRTPEGEAITAAGLPAWLRDIRMTRRGAEANGEMCRILLKGRNDRMAPRELRIAAPALRIG